MRLCPAEETEETTSGCGSAPSVVNALAGQLRVIICRDYLALEGNPMRMQPLPVDRANLPRPFRHRACHGINTHPVSLKSASFSSSIFPVSLCFFNAPLNALSVDSTALITRSKEKRHKRQGTWRCNGLKRNSHKNIHDPEKNN